MTSIEPSNPVSPSRNVSLSGLPPPNGDGRDSATEAIEFGARLAATREARGLTLDECAHALRLPARVLRRIEQGRHEGIDSRVYLENYIRKYAEHIGMDPAALEAGLAHLHPAEPPLIATGGISRSRFLFDRYSTAAIYVVLTAVLVVPMVWLGLRGSLDRDLSRLAPLDATPVATQGLAAELARPALDTSRNAVEVPDVRHTVAAAPADAAPAEQPLLASMAPFPTLDNSPAASDATPQAAVAAGAHALVLSFTAASWVEVTRADGTRLEYGLLPAGSERSYRSDEALDVRIGNVGAASARLDGNPVDLDGYRRANVARFRVAVDDGKASIGNP